MEGLPAACLPSQEAANKLASLKAKALKAKVGVPFPFVELSEFLPNWAIEVSTEPEAEEKPHNKKKLDFIRWITAFKAYALAADATGVRR